MKANRKVGKTLLSPFNSYENYPSFPEPKKIQVSGPVIVPKKQPAPKTPNELLYYGFHAVRAVYKNRREDVIRAYCTEERLEEMGDILKFCAKNKKAYHVVSKEDLEKITLSVHHEGVALLAKRKVNLSEQELYASLESKRQPLIVLDAVSNPHNIGSIMRIMAHFGWNYLICDENYFMPLSASAARMSEGGSEFVDFISYQNQNVFLNKLKSLGYQTLGTSTHGRKSFYSVPLQTKSCAIFLGNEIAGLSKDLIKKLDVTVAIPSMGEVQSLNVAMATTLFIGECVRQDGLKK